MVHRTPEILANDNSPVAVSEVVRGDVSQVRMGWDEAMFARMAREHDLIIHCAATVRFDLAEEDYAAVNIGGTANALALAEAGRMDFLHVSTAYVCGNRNGPIREDDPLPERGFANGYEASKVAGERLVRASNVRWAIARPSVVVGEYDSGAIRQFDTTYAAFKLIAEGRVRHMAARHGATLDFVPIDHVAQGIVAIAESMDRAFDRTFHLVAGRTLPIERFIRTFGAYPQFHEPALVEPEDFDPSVLPALERRLYKRVAGLYAAYFQRDPQFDDSALRELTGNVCPPTGEPYIRRLIDHCIAVGFLSAD